MVSDGKTHDDITWVGIGLAIFSNGLISVSLNVQKYAHMKNEALGEARKPYHHIPVWWLGMIINVIGELGNLIAYGYAEATVVTPIGAVGVVFGAVIATFILGEKFHKTDFLGFLLITGGVILIVYSKGTEAVIEPTVREAIEQYFTTTQCIVYTIVVIASTVLLLGLSEQYGKKYVIFYTGLCSMIAQWTVLGCKCFMAFFRLTVEKNNNQFDKFPDGLFAFGVLLLIIVCAVWSLHYLQQAMRYHDNNKVIPTYYATFTLACIIGAAIVYREFEGASSGAIALFSLGAMLAGAGVAAISRGRIKKGDEDGIGMDGDVEMGSVKKMEKLGLVDGDALAGEARDHGNGDVVDEDAHHSDGLLSTPGDKRKEKTKMGKRLSTET